MIGTVLLILVLGQPSPEFQRGLEFGLAEMRHTAKLLGTDVRLAFEEADAAGAHAAIVASGSAPGAAAIPTIHAGPLPDSSGACDFSIAPPPAAADGARVTAWHPSLDRYGASELNERFERAYGRGMTHDAWQGWVAVKALVESALRQRDGSACAALASLRFDGHKGRSLRFDPATRVLLHPLYVIENGRVVREVK